MTDQNDQIIEAMRASVIRKAIGPTILLGSGTYFDFEDPDSSEITIEDIAYGLAFEGRFAGQCFSRILQRRVLYVVAQHCVLMSRVVRPDLELQALMHEVGEAVCGDMTSPLKSLNQPFKAIEKRCEGAILTRFGIKITDPVALKHADVRMLATERRDLLRWGGEDWSSTDIEPFDFEITPWTPDQAAEAFLERYAELTAKPAVRDPSKLWASEMTDTELVEQLLACEARWQRLTSTDEELGSGSPLEGTHERIQELQREMADRSIPLPTEAPDAR